MFDTLPIIYRDAALVAVHKPSGLLVHRTDLARGERHFALQILRDQLGQRVYPVHRLDRPTSGLLLFALSPAMARAMTAEFTAQRIRKRYLAVVRGIGPAHERLDAALREEDGRRSKADMPAQPACTEVCRLDSVELPVRVDRYPQTRYSLMEARPLTGRRHQIRRHLAGRGYPIIGDAKHGKGVHNRFFREHFASTRLLLAAVGLSVWHPERRATLHLSAAVGDDLQRLFDHFGWAGHLPKNTAHWEEPPSTPSPAASSVPSSKGATNAHEYL
ncbi:tRNA pseudouridine synthase C [Modicisalibacter ilicicola DSM 19980]|uniref:tRNA pseudouridine synthase C n=1 Tax=Modicisalibacter ilicicola DSM 19980 TaxID=1121942 RepID=A0A1M5DXM0_9GAMM|nr:pseudouridine synthase [Halomonas ilicicola]SHF71733.1 tRNA pseudouridine synthase C [Halomonas ilicicola DSM 19980]